MMTMPHSECLPEHQVLAVRDLSVAFHSEQGRVSVLEDAAKNAVERGNGTDMMNVELTICPPGKKERK